MYQTIKEKLAEIQSQEKAEEEPIPEVSEKPESQKPAPAKTQPSNKFTPRKPEKKVVVDITGEVAKEKVHLILFSVFELFMLVGLEILNDRHGFILGFILCSEFRSSTNSR